MKKSTMIIGGLVFGLSILLFTNCSSNQYGNRWLASRGKIGIFYKFWKELEDKEIDTFVALEKGPNGKNRFKVGRKVMKAFDNLKGKRGDILGQDNVYGRVINDNVMAWWIRWKMLNEAKGSIDSTYFILQPDVFGKAFLGLLRYKIENRVKVSLMLDGRGVKYYSRNLLLGGGEDYLQELLNAAPKDAPDMAKITIYNPKINHLLAIFSKDEIRKLAASNHDKIIITDMRYSLTGGRNISRDYFSHNEDHPSAYRDSDILLDEKVEGKGIVPNKISILAEALKSAMDKEINTKGNTFITKDQLGNWSSKRDELEFYRRAMDAMIRGYDMDVWWEVEYSEDFKAPNEDTASTDSYRINYRQKYIEELKKLPHLNYEKDGKKFDEFSIVDRSQASKKRLSSVKVFDKTSILGKQNDLTSSIVSLMNASEKEIIIQNPYVIMVPEIYNALVEAGKREVKIILHTNSPYSTDSIITQYFFDINWKRYLDTIKNLEMWLYVGEKKLHAKVFVFDRKVTAIGTYNMDVLSENINSEVIACIKKAEVAMRTALRIVSHIHGDFAESKKIIPGKFEPRDTIKENSLKAKALNYFKKSPLTKYIFKILSEI